MKVGKGPIDLGGPSGRVSGSLRGVGAVVFGGAVRARRALYKIGLRRSVEVDRPVISIGNLTVGGTGKTPFTIMLARKLEERGRRVAVISRGYGAHFSFRRGAPTLVGEEGQVQRSAEEVGDEPVLIALKTRSSVVVSPDRVAGARFAIERLGANAILLDDGFQHWRLARNLDIVLVDAASPFGNGKLLPAGALREPRGAMNRADLIVVNHGPAGWLAREDLDLGGQQPQIGLGVLPTTVGPLLGGLRQPAATIEGRRVALLAAIAKPERFRQMVRSLGVSEIMHERFFRDHAWLEDEELERFSTMAREKGAEILLTTEKDGTRLVHSTKAAPLWTLAVEPVLLSGEAKLESALDSVSV